MNSVQAASAALPRASRAASASPFQPMHRAMEAGASADHIDHSRPPAAGSEHPAFTPLASAPAPRRWRPLLAAVAGGALIVGAFTCALAPHIGAPIMGLGVGLIAALAGRRPDVPAEPARKAARVLQAVGLLAGTAACALLAAQGVGVVGLALAGVAALAGVGVALAYAITQRRRGVGRACVAGVHHAVGLDAPAFSPTAPLPRRA